MTESNGSEVLFREEQQFRQPWLWALFAGGVAITLAGLLRSLRADDSTVAAPASGLAVATGVGSLLYAAKMVTEVREDSVVVRGEPLSLERQIPFEEIRTCDARTYSALREYGGWGIRCGWNGKAYNVSGNRGVQLQLASGEKLLIGSQKAEELAEAIRARMAA